MKVVRDFESLSLPSSTPGQAPPAFFYARVFRAKKDGDLRRHLKTPSNY
jgi:hypothetical protein